MAIFPLLLCCLSFKGVTGRFLEISDFTCLSKNRCTTFYASLDMSTHYRFMFIWLENQTGIGIKMAVKVGLQNISCTYITLETSVVSIFICLLLKN